MDRHAIENTQKGNLADIKGKRNLLVSFGGIHQGLGMPVFEFFKSLNKVDCDKVFLRDFERAWYQKGVGAEMDHIDKVRAYLKDLIAENQYHRICFLGSSMGAYAAILFGAMLEANKVIAFAPQTFIDRINRLKYYDRRWSEEISRLHSFSAKRKEYFDLKKYLGQLGDFKTEIALYYASSDRLDKKHAERLGQMAQVKLYPQVKGGHEVVKHIRDTGELDEIIRNAFAN